MRDNSGWELDHAALKVLRNASGGSERGGRVLAQVADLTGLQRDSVDRWWAWFERDGREALEPAPGRPATLSDRQPLRLRDILAHKNPRQLQFDYRFWTCDMIATVVQHEFGVRLHRTTVGRI